MIAYFENVHDTTADGVTVFSGTETIGNAYGIPESVAEAIARPPKPIPLLPYADWLFRIPIKDPQIVPKKTIPRRFPIAILKRFPRAPPARYPRIVLFIALPGRNRQG